MISNIVLTATLQTPKVFQPLVLDPWGKVALFIGGLVLTMLLSGYVVGGFIGGPNRANRKKSSRGVDVHSLIGKCENIIAYLFILAGQETGLALIFAAKSLVRAEDIKKDASFYLGGTLVNLVWTMLVAYLVRTLILGM